MKLFRTRWTVFVACALWKGCHGLLNGRNLRQLPFASPEINRSESTVKSELPICLLFPHPHSESSQRLTDGLRRILFTFVLELTLENHSVDFFFIFHPHTCRFGSYIFNDAQPLPSPPRFSLAKSTLRLFSSARVHFYSSKGHKTGCRLRNPSRFTGRFVSNLSEDDAIHAHLAGCYQI